MFPPNERLLGSASRTATLWAFGYGLYRLYYAAGGAFGMLGTPVSEQQWRTINAAAAVLLFVVAALPIALRSWWRTRGGRSIMLALSWVIAVGCTSHALIGMVQRISSLTGALTIRYPFWQTIDRREADLQALFFNEPWFLGMGLLWGIMAWAGALAEAPRGHLWLASAVAVTTVATAIGLLSAFGVIGMVIIG